MIIHKHILHILDKNADEPILNEYEGISTFEVEKFIQKTIKKVNKDDLLRKAKYKDHNDNIIKECCEAIINDEKTFIENSKEIAAYLFDVMKESSDIDSCDLVICLYTIKDERKVAIIKYDYKATYSHIVDYKNDKFYIRMIQAESTISESAKPKQCILVGTSGLNDEYDLKVLDYLAEKKNEKSNFIEKFLKVRKIECDTYKTKRFIDIADVWISNFYHDDIVKAEYMRSLLAYKMCSNSVMDVYEFGQFAFDSREARESFNSLMVNENLEKFNIDKKCSEKKLKYRKIKTDTGINMIVDKSIYYDASKVEIKKINEDEYNVILKGVKVIS